MRCRVIGDAIPFQVFQDAPPFKAGSFTIILYQIKKKYRIWGKNSKKAMRN
jgi:hypothetical protein